VTGAVVGLDAGWQDRAEAEHVLGRASDLCGNVVLACTHVLDGHWTGSLQLSGPAPDPGLLARSVGAAVTTLTAAARSSAGPDEWAGRAARAAAAMSTRSGGRAVVFPGQENLVGEVDTDAVPILSAITEVVGIAGTPTAGTRLITRDHVRPVLLGGQLVLQVRPFGAGSAVAPFEVPNPTPCCATHG